MNTPLSKSMWVAATTLVMASLSFTEAAAQGEVLAADVLLQEVPSKWTIDGDFRFRLEFNDNVASDRHRQRLRFRLGANYQLNERVTLGVRVRTGNPNNPKSPYTDLGDVFNTMEFNLDRLFFSYTPEEFQGLSIVGGKFGNPIFRNPIYGELVWDADLQPEGLAVAFSPKEGMGIFESMRLYGAQIAVLEQSAGEEAWASLLGFNLKKKTGEDSHFSFGVSYTFFGDLTPSGSSGQITSALDGNAMTGAELTSDFGVIDAIAALNVSNFVLTAEIMNNMRAADNVGDTGVVFGGAMNTTKGQFYYSYITIEQDAILSAIAQDDFLFTTNHDSHVVGWKLPLSEDSGLHIWMMASAPNDPSVTAVADEMVYRFRVDWTINF